MFDDYALVNAEIHQQVRNKAEYTATARYAAAYHKYTLSEQRNLTKTSGKSALLSSILVEEKRTHEPIHTSRERERGGGGGGGGGGKND